MTLFGDFHFFGILAVLILPAFIMGCKEKNISWYGLVLTAFFAFSAMRGTPVAMAYMVGYIVYQLILVKGYLKLRLKKGRIGWHYGIVLGLSLLPLAVYKITAFQGHGVAGFLGLSYMTFRTCQMIIETYDGLIKKVEIREFIYFLTFFPALSSGPIDRSRRFHEDYINTPSRKEYLDLAGDGLQKVFLGMIYKFMLAAGAFQAMTWLGDGYAFFNHLIYMYSYGLYLFFDFAGYSLMAVGTGYLLGVRLPDNFNKPFMAVDIKDFWNRWHMSLSYWFRDFVFSRFMMKSIKGKWFKSRLTGASIGFIINMGIMGVWHGLDTQYLLYGLYHGVLLALTEIYQKKFKFHKKNKKKKWYRVIGIIITFNLAMFGFYIFSGEFTRLAGLNWH